MIALTRAISSGIGACELTHLGRTPIDLDRAREQHRAYAACLASLGCEVRTLDQDPDLPDCVFIEDTALVLPEIAVMTRPGAPSRRGEGSAVATALQPLRPLARIESPGTLDGGDVLRIDRTLWVGAGPRSSPEGHRQLSEILTPLGYEVRTASYTGCLHFKSGCAQAARGVVLLNPDWVDPALFDGFEVIEVDPAEPMGANVLLIGDQLIVDGAFPETNRRLRAHGIEVHEVDNSELARAEGGLTCGCLLID